MNLFLDKFSLRRFGIVAIDLISLPGLTKILSLEKLFDDKFKSWSCFKYDKSLGSVQKSLEDMSRVTRDLKWPRSLM